MLYPKANRLITRCDAVLRFLRDLLRSRSVSHLVRAPNGAWDSKVPLRHLGTNTTPSLKNRDGGPNKNDKCRFIAARAVRCPALLQLWNTRMPDPHIELPPENITIVSANVLNLTQYPVTLTLPGSRPKV